MKFLYLKNTIIFNTLQIQKTRVLKKLTELKNCQDTIFGLIIVRAKLIKLLMPYYNIFIRVLRKKPPFKPKHKAFILITIFISLSFKVKHFKVKDKYFLPPVASFYLWDNYLTIAIFVLGQNLSKIVYKSL